MPGVQRNGSPPGIGAAWQLHLSLVLERKDGNVEKFWKELRGGIRSLVDVLSLWNVPWDSLDEALQENFLSYAPNAEELFGIPRMAGAVYPMTCCVAWLEDWHNPPDSPQQEGEETDEASVEEKNDEDDGEDEDEE
ncbi:uncharacterized protein QYS62_007235 [Fusarium acuminatum]|uniref:Uncharacterized protein n=1 Tax=Fusarium acuminatum TaxID=5515 RepID=A0ABZ2X0X2_9HYPO